jgi:hypothetical protein
MVIILRGILLKVMTHLFPPPPPFRLLVLSLLQRWLILFGGWTQWKQLFWKQLKSVLGQRDSPIPSWE